MSFIPQKPLSKPNSRPPGVNHLVKPKSNRQSDLEAIEMAFDILQQYEKGYRLNGDTKNWYFILKSRVNFGPDGVYAGFFMDGPCTLSYELDENGKRVEIRHREIGEAPDGSPIFSGFPVDCWKFCEDFTPDKSWMTISEWNALLAELAPVIARDKKNALADQEAIAERNRKMTAAAASRQNPEASLAAGIATGIAAALQNLGIQPNPKGSA
jgi:hypothetical protein